MIKVLMVTGCAFIVVSLVCNVMALINMLIRSKEK